MHLQAQQLKKVYAKRPVVNGVDIGLNTGEIVGLLGPNGAGKTSTFYMLTGLVYPDSGQVTLNGHCVTHWPLHKRAHMGLSYLPQEASIFRGLTVEENLRAVAQTLKLSKKEQKDRVHKGLHDLGLESIASSKAYQLSGGERRRVEIARALILEPQFILMDEPFSGVDPISIQEVQRLICSLKEQNIGVLITDHNVRETLRIVDRAYLLYEGKVLFSGSANALASNDQARALYLGKDFSL